jgi:hypothetical protein
LSKVVTGDESWIYSFDSEISNNPPNGKVQNFPRPKKVRQVKRKVRNVFVIYFHIKGILQKEFVLTGQTVSSAYCCDILRRQRDNVWRLHTELWWQENLLFH